MWTIPDFTDDGVLPDGGHAATPDQVRVSFIDGPAFDELPRHRQLLVRQLLLGMHTEELWRCDSHPVAVYPDRHPGEQHTALARGWWATYLGSQRGGAPKGWIEVS